MFNYNETQDTPYDPTKSAFHSILRRKDELEANLWPELQKDFFFDDIVQFIDEENFVNYVDFDFVFTFYPETSTKIKWTNRDVNYISRSCEKPKCIPSNGQHKCSIDE